MIGRVLFICVEHLDHVAAHYERKPNHSLKNAINY